MKTIRIVFTLIAFLCFGASSATAEITFLKGAEYQLPQTEELTSWVYQDVGDQNPDPNSTREGYVVGNRQSTPIQFGWPSYENQPWKMVIADGKMIWHIGEGVNESITTTDFVGTNRNNAIYITIFAQSFMNQNSPTRGISFTITKINGVPIANANLTYTFTVSTENGDRFAVLYGFEDINNLTIEGYITMINPSSEINPYDYAFTMDFGLYVKPGTEGTLDLQTSEVTVNESTGEATIDVVRTSGSNGDVSVDYTINDGTAIQGSDMSTTNGTITLYHGETSKKIIVGIINDNDHEDTENFTVTLSNPQGGASLGSGTSATVTINDDDELVVDNDNDGIDDDWENFYFENLTSVGIGTDYDHDGILDTEEYLQNLDPMSPPVSDTAIGTKTKMVGELIFNRTGQSQVLRKLMEKKTVTSFVTVRNNSLETRPIALWGNGGNRYFRVRYFMGSTDITEEVISGTFETESLAPNATKTIKVSVTKKTSKKKSFRVNIDSGNSAPWSTDRVIYKVSTR